MKKKNGTRQIEQFRCVEMELDSTMDQTTLEFLNQYTLLMEVEERVELIFNDEDLIRQFTCFLLRQINEFVHRPETIKRRNAK